MSGLDDMMAVSDVISERELAFYRGRKMRRDGKPCPPKPADECDGTEPESLLWIGWRVEMMIEFESAERAARLVGIVSVDFCDWADRHE